ncbi:hypothetical protein [Microbispora sp. NPDC049633]|uniref:hypothetical protein n=1 Tax=Microbispora sp. NPDC049633 TaxID=3154355 RepID=UPI00342A9480
MRRSTSSDHGRPDGLGMIIMKLPCGITVYGHGGTLDGYLTGVTARSGGTHTLACVINGSWGAENQIALMDKAYIAELCGSRQPPRRPWG